MPLRLLAVVALVLVVPALAFADPDPVTVTKKDIVLARPIYFDTGKPTIKKESFAVLDALAKALHDDAKITLLEIQSHTDARGDAKFNLAISQKRADAILDYLVGKGVDKKRLRARGYGESQPLDKGANEKAWAKNRRTTFVIMQHT
jgi:outer membrane protein OmpA-like peptidoglycan-associated protein